MKRIKPKTLSRSIPSMMFRAGWGRGCRSVIFPQLATSPREMVERVVKAESHNALNMIDDRIYGELAPVEY